VFKQVQFSGKKISHIHFHFQGVAENSFQLVKVNKVKACVAQKSPFSMIKGHYSATPPDIITKPELCIVVKTIL
jgi:hypothetical protein